MQIHTNQRLIKTFLGCPNVEVFVLPAHVFQQCLYSGRTGGAAGTRVMKSFISGAVAFHLHVLLRSNAVWV